MKYRGHRSLEKLIRRITEVPILEQAYYREGIIYARLRVYAKQ